MAGRPMHRRRFAAGCAACLAGAVAAPLASPAALAAAGRRALALVNPNTGESWSGIYYDGGYLKPQTDALDWFLRDHHEDVFTRIDPALLDLLWRLRERYRIAGHGAVTIAVHSAYRTAQTNETLRSEGAALRSLHMEGKAADVTVPGFGIYMLNNFSRLIDAGGRGLYRRGGQGFMHLDVGAERRWFRP